MTSSVSAASSAAEHEDRHRPPVRSRAVRHDRDGEPERPARARRARARDADHGDEQQRRMPRPGRAA